MKLNEKRSDKLRLDNKEEIKWDKIRLDDTRQNGLNVTRWDEIRSDEKRKNEIRLDNKEKYIRWEMMRWNEMWLHKLKDYITKKWDYMEQDETRQVSPVFNWNQMTERMKWD